MKWRPENFVESLIPLLTVLAIIGHGPFHYPPGRRHPRFTLVYVITAMSLYYVLLGFTIKYFCDSPWYDPRFERACVIVYANLAIATLAQILSWHYFETLTDITKRIGKIDETLQELGATFDYTTSMNLEIGMIILWILVSWILNGAEISLLIAIGPLEVITIIVNILLVPVHINSMVAYNFSIMVTIVGMRFRKANELLENIVKPIRQSVNDRGWSYLGRQMGVIPFTISTKPIFRGTAYKKYLIYIMKHVHLELSAISQSLNRAYGVQVALEITACFIIATTLLYDIYKVVTYPSLPRRYVGLTVPVIWCAMVFAKVIKINQVCEAISNEAHRTGDILHRMEKPIGDPELPDEIQQFSLQIMQNRLYFSPAGVVTLGWKFLCGFVETVATYLVIFIQNGGVLG